MDDDEAQRQQIMAALVARRRELGMKQIDIATALGVGQQAVSHWEHNPDIRLSTLLAYARLVGMELQVWARIA